MPNQIINRAIRSLLSEDALFSVDDEALFSVDDENRQADVQTYLQMDGVLYVVIV